MTRPRCERVARWLGGVAFTAGLLLGSVSVGCHKAAERLRRHAAHEATQKSAANDVVSTVGTNEITLREVSELVSAGLSPQESLRRLQSQGVLMDEAERLGFGDADSVRSVAEQALVQALLAREVDSLIATDADLRAAYDTQRARFETPERRLAAHVLAKLAPGSLRSDAELKAFAADEIKLLERASDIDAFLAKERSRAVPGIMLIAERLPEVDHASVPGAFGDALFGLSEPGVVKNPVHSRQGWHAVRLLSIIKPEVRVAFEQARETLRPEVIQDKKTKRLASLIAELRERTPVTMAPNVRELLGALKIE